MLFGDIGQSVVGKQVGAVLRSSRGTDQIPPEIAQVVCTKYTWHINITEKSFHGPKKSFQVNRVVTSFGRQTVIPRLYHSVHTTTSASEPTAYIEDDPFEKSLTPEILQHTPPASTRLSITEGEKRDLEAMHEVPSSAQKRLFDVAATSDQNVNVQDAPPTKEHTSHGVTNDEINPTREKNARYVGKQSHHPVDYCGQYSASVPFLHNIYPTFDLGPYYLGIYPLFTLCFQ